MSCFIFRCGACDRRFSSSVLLDSHKAELDHWSEDEIPFDSQDEDPDSLRDCMNDQDHDLFLDKNQLEIESEMLLL